MIFTQVAKDENYDVVKYTSQGGRWDLGLKAMFFGVRLRFGLANYPVADLDYCAGDDIEFQLDLLRAVTLILLPVPEEITPREICDMFPKCRVKPVCLDPCWDVLVRMAAEALSKA